MNNVNRLIEKQKFIDLNKSEYIANKSNIQIILSSIY